MPFPQHLDRTARVSGEGKLSGAERARQPSKPPAPLDLHSAIQASAHAAATKCTAARAHAELPRDRSEPKQEQDGTQAPLANIASLQTISGTI